MKTRSTLAVLALVGALSACSSAPPAADSSPNETTAAPTTTAAAEAEAEAEPAPEPESGPETSSAIDLATMPAADTAPGVAARVAQAHGAEALNEVGEIQFVFRVVNAKQEVFKAMHRWDLENGRARVQWADTDTPIIAVVDLSDRTKGWVTIDGKLASGKERAEYLEAAFGRWTNDAYWLAMPLKLTDPGVNLELVDDREHDGRVHRVLKLTFGEVGLTPGDTYWVYADAETYRVSRWDMLLQNAEPDAEPTWVDWTNPATKGGLTLMQDHPVKGTPRNIVTEVVEVSTEVDEAAYAEPAASE